MARRTAPGAGIGFGWNAGENGIQDQLDDNWLVLSLLANGAVLSRVASLPGSPNPGDVYLLTAGADTDKIAYRVPAYDNLVTDRPEEWRYLSPQPGFVFRVLDEAGLPYRYDGSSWVPQFGSAAFEASSAFDPSGTAQAAYDEAIKRANHTGTQPLSTISDAGAAASRGVVGGSGNLMAQGYQGLGADPTTTLGTLNDINNLDLLVDTNSFGLKGLLNFLGVSGIPDGLYQCLVLPRSQRGRCVFYRNNNSDFFYASKYAAGWQGPFSLYSTSNILGTVSQSAGVPTGAIIERGSNANGEYVKFADGTLVCRHVINLGSAAALGGGTPTDPYRSAQRSWTYSHAYATPPEVFLSVRFNGVTTARALSAIYNSNSTSLVAGIQAIRANGNSDATDVFVTLFAIGLWY